MTFNEYQEQAHKTAGTKSCLEMCALGLSGESGEVADHIKKVIYHDHGLDIDALILEVGDVLWYVAETCTQLGITIEELADQNIAKLRQRYGDKFSTDASINRQY